MASRNDTGLKHTNHADHPFTASDGPGLRVMPDLPARPITVLVAGDDDREDTKQLLRELSSAGYELRWVGSAEEAADAPYAIVSTRALTELAELRHDALHDALTGLPNRALFLDRLELSLRRSRRQTEEFCCAVLFLDLDRFKLVNDSLGHLVGDRLLMAVAKRLEAALRPGDTVARIGGDEFTLLLDDIGDVHGASVVAERLHESLSAPFEVGSREIYVSASIGIALVTADRAPEDVVRDADVAMYRAKAPGRRAPRRLRRGDARAPDGAARARDRPAAGDRARRAARPLPAGDPDRDGRDRGLRGAVPLDGPAAAARSSRASSCRSPTRPG